MKERLEGDEIFKETGLVASWTRETLQEVDKEVVPFLNGVHHFRIVSRRDGLLSLYQYWVGLFTVWKTPPDYTTSIYVVFFVGIWNRFADRCLLLLF